MLAKVQQTEFQIEKLRNVVGVGNCSAYQICVSPGTVLGRMGTVPHVDSYKAANHGSFREATAGVEQRDQQRAWLKRVVSSLKS
jgi:hypothetical protein